MNSPLYEPSKSYIMIMWNLLVVYGFSNLSVTQKSKDGGIDGFGKLKIGIAHMSVAFQCKRWNVGSVGRKEIDAFRGAIQGEYE